MIKQPKRFKESGKYRKLKRYKQNIGTKIGSIEIIDFPGYIERADSNKSFRIAVRVKCDCGLERITAWTPIRSGKTSCNCKNKRYKLDPTESSRRSVYTKLRNRKKKVNLTYKQFCELSSSNCTYCGIKPLQYYKANGSRKGYVYNGIDRVDSSKGYSISNCVPCCKYCNFAKNDLSLENFKAMVKNRYNHMFRQSKLGELIFDTEL